MFQKNDSKLITGDVKLINEQLKTVELEKPFKQYINRNIFFIKNELKDIVSVKKIGSYAINGIYNFDQAPKIDLLALKYVNKDMYNTYQQEIETRDHFDDCWNCELNEVIYQKLKKKYEIIEDIQVNYLIKKVKVNVDSKEFFQFKDAVQIDFYKEDKIGFSIIIRIALCHNQYPAIICRKQRYYQTNALEYVKAFKTLNKLTIRKVEILFFYIRLNYRKEFSNKQRLMAKILILSDLQYQLVKNSHMQDWLTQVFNHLFPNKKIIDNIFQSNNLYYKKLKLFEKMYRSFNLKHLDWVFHNTYPNTKDFLDKYLEQSKHWINEKAYLDDNIYFWYDSNPYIKNTLGNSNYTMKKNKKLYDDLDIFIHSKNIYPSDKEIGLFLVFLSYYRFNIINIEKEVDRRGIELG
ncbi:hypothetical protein [Spiroplasma culicicola]|uniref:Uncharacterized protein n=1 Tax=Spiroplasma culicicola AES-1 TaxID=1276246 RepID=W6A6N6_9MOLU|nr:hypothetical protein [Spiroplasma culicicola]AHI52748.1 hypothetical protein SCULI_v1c04070 [Spiroplasma culicicola AES-1]